MTKRIALCGWLILAAGGASAAAVSLESATTCSFSIRTGEYRVDYAPLADMEMMGWVRITRGEGKDGIATKLAYGQHLDVSDAGAGEGAIYNWTDKRKDCDMFRSLACQETPDAVTVRIATERQWAKFDSVIVAPKATPGLIHWTVTATAKQDKAFSGKSKPDCVFLAKGRPTEWGENPQEMIRYSVMRGPCAPHVFFRDPRTKSFVYYFEDLTSLNDLYRLTKSEVPYDYPENGNPGSVRMGKAEMYFQMSSPDGNSVKPLKPFEPKTEKFSEFGYERPQGVRVPAGKKLVLADTYLYLKPAEKTDNATVCRNFVEMLADIYPAIKKPDVIATDWAGRIVPQLVKDVMRPENSATLGGKHILPRAYVGYEHQDYQLWTILQLLHPLELYVKQHPGQKDAVTLRNRLSDCLPAYLDKEWGGFHNNPAPIQQDMFFTVVYIFSQTVMMSDLARLGNENAKTMLTGFRDRLLKMGKAYDYVMADIWLRDFSKQKTYYQADSTCCYLYTMMALYDLSGGKDTECLEAAKAAARKLGERCMDLMWEANMTAAGVVGCEQLFKATGDPQYRDLAYIPLANVLANAWLWECDFGIGEKTTNFWAFSGCPAAPCSAEFENSRVRFHFKDWAAMTAGVVAPNVTSMVNDAWRRGPTQSRFTLPPLVIEAGAKDILPAEGKSQTNCGEIRHDQMIPLEDYRVGWGTDVEWWQNNAKPGVVGQEIYGAGGPIWYAVWQDELK